MAKEADDLRQRILYTLYSAPDVVFEGLRYREATALNKIIDLFLF
jgi:hypothetical protein